MQYDDFSKGRRTGLREALEIAMKVVNHLPIPEPKRGARIVEAEILRLLEKEVTNGYSLPRRASVGLPRDASKDRADAERLSTRGPGLGERPSGLRNACRHRKYSNPRRISVG